MLMSHSIGFFLIIELRAQPDLISDKLNLLIFFIYVKYENRGYRIEPDKG